MLKIVRYCVMQRTPNNVRQTWLAECAVSAMRKKMQLSSVGGNSGSKKCKQGKSVDYCEVWQNLRLVGVLGRVACARSEIRTGHTNLLRTSYSHKARCPNQGLRVYSNNKLQWAESLSS
jgi:hypothetical protein